jgi:multicomponent K+:H+ antiporter subunit E
MSKSRWFPLPVVTLLVLVLWVLLNDSASVGTLVIGALLAVGIPRLTARFWPHPPRLRNGRAAWRLGFRLLGDIVVANWAVARRVVGPTARLRPAFFEVPLDVRDGFVATLLGSMVSLTPGTVSIDVDRERWVLQVHALDIEDPQQLLEQIKVRYEAPLREIFEC